MSDIDKNLRRADSSLHRVLDEVLEQGVEKDALGDSFTRVRTVIRQIERVLQMPADTGPEAIALDEFSIALDKNERSRRCTALKPTGDRCTRNGDLTWDDRLFRCHAHLAAA